MATIRRRNKKYQVQIRKNAHQSISKTFIDLKAARKWANHMEDRIELQMQDMTKESLRIRGLRTHYQGNTNHNHSYNLNHKYYYML